jgi:hypothetical protein
MHSRTAGAVLLIIGAVNRYDVIAHGEKKFGIPEEEVARLYSSGALNRRSPCRVYGSDEWKNIDECLPLLKYTSQSLAPAQVPQPPPPRPANPLLVRGSLDTDEGGQPARTTALRAGWACFALGLSVTWFFPPAYILFLVAVVTAIVAMCTRQASQGIILMLSSFLGAAVCLFVSFVLAVGFFAVVADHALTEVRTKMEQTAPTQGSVVPIPALSPTPQSVPPSLPRVQTTARIRTPTATPIRPIASLSQREIFEELARIEKQQRELRAQRLDLSTPLRARLEQLRAALE